MEVIINLRKRTELHSNLTKVRSSELFFSTVFLIQYTILPGSSKELLLDKMKLVIFFV